MQARGSRWAFLYVALVFCLTFAGVGVIVSASGALGRPATAALRPAAVKVLHLHGYEVQLLSVPTRLGQDASTSVRLLRAGRAVQEARVRVSFSMPDMPGMDALGRSLTARGAGLYSGRSPVLTVGVWRLSVTVTPRTGESFRVGFADRISL